MKTKIVSTNNNISPLLQKFNKIERNYTWADGHRQHYHAPSIIFFNTDSIIILHPVQPLDVTGVPSGHMSHLSPIMPGLQIHLPLICSQFVLMEPKGEQTHAEKDTAKFFTKN